ncbi:MAG TPA: hypothetical protein VFU21_13265 [Kofleriaceae bacterium]|nr:hypothetical protein [Kofleriaceae bacterium]
MHRLLTGWLLLVALTQGCIIIDDIEEACGDELDRGACFAISASCPPDAVNLDVFTQPVGVTGALTAEFSCAAGGAVLVDPGTYDLRVEASNAEDDVLFGAEPVLDQTVEELEIVDLTFDFPEGQGFFWLNWTLEMGGSAVTCADVGAADIEVVSTPATGPATTDVLPCVYGGWQTRGLDLGDYDVTVTLLDDGGTALGPPSEPIPGELAADSELVALPSVTFDITAAAR